MHIISWKVFWESVSPHSKVLWREWVLLDGSFLKMCTWHSFYCQSLWVASMKKQLWGFYLEFTCCRRFWLLRPEFACCHWSLPGSPSSGWEVCQRPRDRLGVSHDMLYVGLNEISQVPFLLSLLRWPDTILLALFSDVKALTTKPRKAWIIMAPLHRRGESEMSVLALLW